VGVSLMAAVLGSLLVLSGCGAGASGSKEEALRIFSGRGEDLVKPLLDRFARESGISIEVRYDDSANLALKIDQEGGNVKADVFLSQSPGTVGFLAEKGRLGTIDGALLDRVNEKFRSPNGLWVGVSGRQRVLVYNQDQVAAADLPQSVFELTQAKYNGKVGIAPTNASFEDYVSTMRELVGDDRTLEWMTAMKQGGAKTYPNNNAIVAAVGRGEIPFGLVNHYYNYRALAEDPKLPSRNHTFKAGDPGSMILMTTVSVLKTARDKDKAAKFVQFLLSNEAQEYFTRADFEYPLVSGIPPRQNLPPLDLATSPSINLDSLGGELKGTLAMIDRSGLGR
jgi:iron(III) transport system substrate-binding protein